MKLLRDKRELTKLLLLFELTTGRYRTFKSLAEKFDITIQAISDYFKIMTEEGLVHKIEGDYKATPQGVAFLHEHFLELREFVEKGIDKLSIMNTASAKAGNNIKKGDSVGLFMEKGVLVAYPNRNSSSVGVASTSAKKGEDVGIDSLEGIVKLKSGKITIINLPNINEGGSKAVQLDKLKSKLRNQKPDITAVQGITAEIVADKLGVIAPVKFGIVNCAIEAAQRGLKVVILTTDEFLAELKLNLEKYNQDSMNRIEYKIQQI
ncbi:MAG: hypothetical protein JSV49_06375 [Thermoplasmata archaeon]|nr:MAG: hypothetical protein JSV49_06375 [Thermoplasmata archaeon]